MTIALIEPFYTGSHKAWADGLQERSAHEIQIFKLPGRHWKWRMHAGAITLADQVNNSKENYDCFICSDMLDVALFKASLNNEYSSLPTVLYMHENQLTYPWSPQDQDVELKRDNHYAFINYTSCLIADTIWFNSDYHRNSFITELTPFLRAFPDDRNLKNVQLISDKSSTVHLGLNLWNSKEKPLKSEAPVILWNHRWEYDKAPDQFFELLTSLQENNFNFRLNLLGERYQETPAALVDIRNRFKDEILFDGYAESRAKYWEILNKSDILPVCSIQDFFGISIVEAISAGVTPVLPNRLAYPEYVSDENLYTTKEELISKVMRHSHITLPNVDRFEWGNMIDTYDKAIAKLIS